MAQIRKISVSISADLVENLDFLSSRLGVSRSAILSEVLSGPVLDMRRILETVPPNPTPSELVRMRGESREVVQARLASLQGMANDLFSK